MTTITLTRTLTGLVPADDESRKRLARVPSGDTRQYEYRERRNGAMHRRYWALCGLVSQNVEGYNSAEQVSDHIKILAGHCTPIASKATGEVYLIPKSISFANMDQGGFDDFWSRAVKAVCGHLLPGVTEAEIENEILSLVGASTWAA